MSGELTFCLNSFLFLNNQPSSTNNEAINRLPQVKYNPLHDELPTVSEIVKAIKLLLSGNASGSDAIPAERSSNYRENDRVISDYVERGHPSIIQR